MIRSRRLGRLAAGLSVALLVGACVSLLPKAPPTQLYRFAAPSGSGGPAAAGAVGVRLSDVSLPPASGGNDILTMNGAAAAYVKDARWVSSASSLFAAAVTDAFAAHGGPTRLLAQGEPGAAFALRLDVRRFEVRYGQGPTPTVDVEVYAILARASGVPNETAETFRVATPASGDRMGAIVEAYDRAVGTVLGQVIDWVNAETAS